MKVLLISLSLLILLLFHSSAKGQNDSPLVEATVAEVISTQRYFERSDCGDDLYHHYIIWYDLIFDDGSTLLLWVARHSEPHFLWDPSRDILWDEYLRFAISPGDALRFTDIQQIPPRFWVEKDDLRLPGGWNRGNLFDSTGP